MFIIIVIHRLQTYLHRIHHEIRDSFKERCQITLLMRRLAGSHRRCAVAPATGTPCRAGYWQRVTSIPEPRLQTFHMFMFICASLCVAAGLMLQDLTCCRLFIGVCVCVSCVYLKAMLSQSQSFNYVVCNIINIVSESQLETHNIVTLVCVFCRIWGL